MDIDSLELLIQKNNETIAELESRNWKNAQSLLSDEIPLMQKVFAELVEFDLVNNELILTILKDINSSINNADYVEQLDTLKYGLGILLNHLVSAIGENN